MNKSFLLLQANVVFNQQLSLFQNNYVDNKKGRNEAFKRTINKFIEKKIVKVSPRITEYILVYVATITDNIIYCQLAKKSSVETYSLKDNIIEADSVASYPPLDVFINLNLQQFAVELNSKILSIQVVEKTIKNLINSLVKDYSIFFNTIEDKKEFWNTVSNDDSIQEISFDLVVPNFFGATKEAKDLVEGAKSDVNADSVVLTFKNKKGGLRADMQSIDSFVKYSSTSGSWKMKIKQQGQTKYKIIKSTDYCKQKEIEEDIIELVRNINDNAQIGTDLYNGLIDRLNGLFENEN